MNRLKTLQRRNVVLLVLALVMTGVLVARPSQSSSSNADSWNRAFPDFQTDLVRRIVIRRDSVADGEGETESSTLTLAQGADGAWVVASEGGYPARADAVATLLDGISNMRTRKVVTTRAETFDKYTAHDGFTEIQVLGPGDKVLASFALGRDADKYPEVFTRVGDGNEQRILQTIHVTRSMAETRLTNWIEPRLWIGLRAELMIRMDVQQGEDRIVLARRGESPADIEGDVPEAEEGKVWWVLEPEPAGDPRDDGAIENLGRFFTGLRIERVAGVASDEAAKQALGMDPPAAVVTFWQRVGDEIERSTLSIGQKTEDGRRYRVMRSGAPWVYEVPSYTLSDFLGPLSNFRPSPPDDPDDAGSSDDAVGDDK